MIGLFLAAATPTPLSNFSQDQNRRMLAEFAACVVHRRPHVAARYLLKDMYTPDNLLNADCIPRVAPHLSVYAPPLLIRYAIADALIQFEAPLKLPDLSTIPPLKIQTSYSDGDNTSLPILRFGECVVRTAPADAGRLLEAAVTTPKEDSAFTALAPAFSGCLFKGQTGKFSKEVIRGTIALNYYRLAHVGDAKK